MRASPAEEAPDLRLVLPAVSAWMVAWQVRVLPSAVVVGAALLLGLAAAVVLLRWRSTTWGLVLAASLVCAAASAASTAARVEVRSAGPLPGLASRAAAVAVTPW